MTNNNATKTSFAKQAATALAFAAAPFAIVLGIAGMVAIDAPSAEAYSQTTCRQIGNMVRCTSF